MTATLRPVESDTSSSQAVVWMTLPAKSVDARDVGHLRLGQKARRGDQVARGQRFAVGQRDPPDAGLLVPAGALDDGVEPHVRAHVVLVRDIVGVLLDLRARGEQPRPVRVRLEEVGVGGGGDVDGQARIAVDVPGAAEVVLAVEDHEVVVAHPLELDGRAYPAETGPHDDRVELLRSHDPDGTSGTGKLDDRAQPLSDPVRGGSRVAMQVTARSPCVPRFRRRIQHVQLHRVVGDRIGCRRGQFGLALVLVLLDRGLPGEVARPASSAPRTPRRRAIGRSRRCRRSTPGCCPESP